MVNQDMMRVRVEASGTDPDAAVSMFKELYHGTRWTTAPVAARAFMYEHKVIGNPSMTLRTSKYHGDLEGEIVPDGEEYIVQWVTSGHGVLDEGRANVAVTPGTPVMFPADHPFRFRYSDYDQKLVHFDRALLERVAAEQTGSEVGPLAIDSTVRPTEAAIRTWGRTMNLVSRTMVDGASSPLLQAEMARLAAVAFLELYPHQAAQLPPALLLPRNARIRAAVEFIHANAHLVISPTSIARAANLSVRSLQEGFQREFGMAPSTFVRSVRLDGVHRDLRSSDPSATTVQEIAVRWGFAHLGRFSAAYAERFGEYPKETLRR